SGGQCGAPPIAQQFDRALIEQGKVEVGTGDANAQEFVGIGQALGDQKIVVVDPETRERHSSNQVGEIWISGGSVARGYWNRKEASDETFNAHLKTGEGPFLRTGDLGFWCEGELFISGRRKDL